MSLCVWWGEGGLWTHIKREGMQNLRMLLCNYEPNVAHVRYEKHIFERWRKTEYKILNVTGKDRCSNVTDTWTVLL